MRGCACPDALPSLRPPWLDADECDVRIAEDRSVSRRHAILQVAPASPKEMVGPVDFWLLDPMQSAPWVVLLQAMPALRSKVTVKDSGATFGVHINGRTLKRNESAELSEADTIQVGGASTQFR